MKRFLLPLLLSLFFGTLAGQTTLSIGDIAIIGINTDRESFTFVTLVNLQAGTTIYFTDEEPTGNTLPVGMVEGLIAYTAPSAIAEGTVIVFNNEFGTGFSGDFNLIEGAFVLANGGEGILAFQGYNSSTGQITSLLHQIGEDLGDLGTPAQLSTNDQILLGEDNGEYTGTRSAFKSTLYSEISNESVNWTTNNDFSSYNLNSLSFNVASSSPPPSISVTSFNHVSCNGGSNGSITVSVTSGTPPYTYSWSNGALTANTNATTNTLSGLSAGNYSVTVTDANSATANTFQAITQRSPIALITSSGFTTCNGGSDGELTAFTGGGAGGFTYLWSNGATTQTASGLAAGTYTVTATDANGCSKTETGTVTEPTAVSVSIRTDSVETCLNGQNAGLTARASGGNPFSYTYLWSNGATTESISGIGAGTYSVTVTDPKGCTGTSSVTLDNSNYLTVSISKVDAGCVGSTSGRATANATGGKLRHDPPFISTYQYLWSNGATTTTANNLGVGTYTVTVTDDAGCTATSTVTIGANSDLTVSLTSQNNNCSGASQGQIRANVSGGASVFPPFSFYNYTWSNGVSGMDVYEIRNLSAGTYSVTVTDGNGCTVVDSVTITEPDPITVNMQPTDVSCPGSSDGAIRTVVTGGTTPYYYEYYNLTSHFELLDDFDSVVNNLQAASYSVTVTDNNGCKAYDTVAVGVSSNLSAGIAVNASPSCANSSDGSLSISASNGSTPYNYLWSNGATTPTASGLAAGNYSVTVTDGSGCSVVRSAALNGPPAIIATTSVSSTVSCNGGSDGGASVSASNGVAPYTYLWSNGATTASIQNVQAGSYTVTVTDNGGCSVSESIVLTQPAALQAYTAIDSNVTCPGALDGGASSGASGGITPYTYAWSTGSNVPVINGVGVGTYTVTITDANGCTAVDSVTLGTDGYLSATAIARTPDCAALSNGFVNLVTSGGRQPYTYLWSTGSTNSSIHGLDLGTYSVTVTDANGCTTTSSASLNTYLSTLAVSATKTDVLCAGGSTGSATANATGGEVRSLFGSSSYQYLWSTGATTRTVNNLAAGSYTVTVTDDDGCTATTQVTIAEPSQALSSSFSISSLSCFGGTDGTATVIPSGGTAPYTYLWGGGQTTAGLSGLSAGTYSVTITDSQGCQTTNSIQLTQPSALDGGSIK